MPLEPEQPAPGSLTELILDQSMAGVAVPVLLLGPDDDPTGADDLWSAEAYVRQCRYGQELLESPAARQTTSGVLALNFHELRPENRESALVGLTALAQAGPSWSPDGSSGLQVFVGFYDGYRETALWGAEVCDRLGLRACFFPIFAATEPGSAELDDDDLAGLAKRHAIGFHTASHLFIEEIDEANVAAEVDGTVERIRSVTGEAPVIGAWCGGSRFDDAHVGNRALRRAGVRFLISNWSIEPVPPI